MGFLNDVFDGMRYLDKEGLIDIKPYLYLWRLVTVAMRLPKVPIMEPDLFKCAVSDVGVYDHCEFI